MSTVANIPIPSPPQIMKDLFPNGLTAPLGLNACWTAKVLLTPFSSGTVSVAGGPSDQVTIGQLTYEAAAGFQLMRAGLFLLESQVYFDYLFLSKNGVNQWWALVSDPANPDVLPTAAFGPYECAATVPLPNFLADYGFSNVGRWEIHGEPAIAFSARREAQAGTWVWFDAQDKQPSRMMNVDSVNDFQIPILGAYYLADFPKWTSMPATNLQQVLAACPQGTSQPGPSLMLTLSDIEKAMSGSSAGQGQLCSLAQIQAQISGISYPAKAPITPAWTDKVSSVCYMVGQDIYPYYCQLWYDWNAGMQVTVFVTQDAGGTYTQRQDMYLPKGQVGPAANYVWNGDEWTTNCCTADGGVVPMSVPNFVQVAEGQCRAVIADNPYFGDLSIWTVQLGVQGGTTSDFWYWFNDAMQGVVFSLAPAGSLTLIDYQTFVQNGDIPAAYLDSPCNGIPVCGSDAAPQSSKLKIVPSMRVR